MTDINIGASLTRTGVASMSRRPSGTAISNADVLTWAAHGPTGVRRLTMGTASRTRTEEVINVRRATGVTEPTTDGDWLAVIWSQSDAYLMADGRNGIATIGTPVLRLTDNGPAKAVLVLPPIGSYTWSDGTTGPIERGMSLALFFRDADTGYLFVMFKGAIRQIDRGETVTLTAYDRIMDLADYSDQYQPANAHAAETSWNRTINGSDYDFTFTSPIGTMISSHAYTRVTADPLAEMDGSTDSDFRAKLGNGVVCYIPLVDYTGAEPAEDTPITHLKAKLNWMVTNGGISLGTTIRTTFALVRVSGSTAHTLETPVSVTSNVAGSGSTVYPEANVNWNVTAGGGLCIAVGIEVTADNVSDVDNTKYSLVNLYDSSTRYFTSTKQRYKSGSIPSQGAGGTVESVTDNWEPEIAVTYTVNAGTVNIGSITAGGTTASVPASAIPDFAQVTEDSATITQTDKGVALYLDYYALGNLQVTQLVSTLIEAAGLAADIPAGADFGTLSYYTTSTFDYLTCVQELIRAHGYGIKDTYVTGKEGTVRVRPRHTLGEAPSVTYTTDPAGAGQRVIVSHDLTAHWMAERATQAIIAEDVLNSGLPIALETDDERMDNSLALAIGTPLRGVSTDTSAGSHAMLASAAGGKMVQLHTNVYEGKVTLAGYRLSVWDDSWNGEGGKPIALDVPEAAVSGTAIPTEVIFGDGVTQVSLDNIRTADRSEVARSMGLTADGVSNNSQSIAATMYIFGKLLTYATDTAGTQPASFGGMYLMDATGNVLASQTTGAFLKTVSDAAGYTHYCAVFRPEDHNGAAASTPVALVGVGSSSNAYVIAPLDNPKNILATQTAHIDIRVPNSAM